MLVPTLPKARMLMPMMKRMLNDTYSLLDPKDQETMWWSVAVHFVAAPVPVSVLVVAGVVWVSLGVIVQGYWHSYEEERPLFVLALPDPPDPFHSFPSARARAYQYRLYLMRRESD